jgi:hypothetical protein
MDKVPGADFIIKKIRFPCIITQRRFLYNEYLAQQPVGWQSDQSLNFNQPREVGYEVSL